MLELTFVLVLKSGINRYECFIKDCKQRTHYGLENGSLGFIETLHKQFATLLTPSSVYMSRTPIPNIHNGPNDPNGNEI